MRSSFNKNIYTFILLNLYVYIFISSAVAQNSIDVQRLSSKGDHFKAILNYVKIPKNKVSIESVIAASRSYWALGLIDKALKEFEKVSREENLNSNLIFETLFSRAIINFQEGRYELSSILSENTIENLPEPSLTRAKAWFLWGESLFNQKYAGKSVDKYIHAIEEASSSIQNNSIQNNSGKDLDFADDSGINEMYFSLGKAYLDLGNIDDARTTLLKIRKNSEKYPLSLRLLAKLSIDSKQFEDAKKFLEEGKNNYTDNFIDSWVDYGDLQIAISNKDNLAVNEIIKKANEKYSPSDDWLAIINGTSELFLMSNLTVFK